MARCGKCGEIITQGSDVWQCVDCASTYHEKCLSREAWDCPVCELCGIKPVKTEEKMRQYAEFQAKAARYEKIVTQGESPSEQVVMTLPDDEFEKLEDVPIEELKEIVEEASEPPRKLYSFGRGAVDKGKYTSLLLYTVAMLCIEGFRAGHWYPFLIAGVVGLGGFIWSRNS